MKYILFLFCFLTASVYGAIIPISISTTQAHTQTAYAPKPQVTAIQFDFMTAVNTWQSKYGVTAYNADGSLLGDAYGWMPMRGGFINVHAGDWIITQWDGEKIVVSNSYFTANYSTP